MYDASKPVASRRAGVTRHQARGRWETMKAEAEGLFQLAQEAYVRSSLPPEPDRNRAEKLCVKMIAEHHGLNFG